MFYLPSLSSHNSRLLLSTPPCTPPPPLSLRHRRPAGESKQLAFSPDLPPFLSSNSIPCSTSVSKQQNLQSLIEMVVSGASSIARGHSIDRFYNSRGCYRAELASQEKNMSAAVALNAEIRRTKARLMEVPKLQRAALKKFNIVRDVLIELHGLVTR